jgi:hypothetical protein
MSTLTTTSSDALFPASTEAKPARKPFLRSVYEAIVASRERRAEREIAAYIERHGGLLTDDMEREIMRHLNGHGSIVGR